MRVFITGASGFIGSAIVRELLAANHRVVGLVRSDSAARALVELGGEPLLGSLEDAASLQRGAAAADGVIHTAYNHDFTGTPRDVAASADERAIETMGTVLAGSDRPLLITSGLARLASGGVFTESDAPPAEAGRRQAERVALAFAAQRVRCSVVRLPPSVHGEGDRAFVPLLIGIARQRGVSAHVGDGQNRWPAVHRLDAARLFRLALEQGAAGSIFHGVAEEGVPTKQIAEAIGRRLGVPVASTSRDEAAAHFGWIGGFFGLDAPASSQHTRQQLGWRPQHPSLLADLDGDYYFSPSATTKLA